MACSTTKPTVSPEVPKIQPKFDYAPKALSEVGSAEITIALVNPIYGDPYLSMNPFEDMRKNLANDFEELLIAKGFTIRGPFNQHGEMLYNDKINSDFVFEVEIDLSFKGVDRKYRTIRRTNWGNVILNAGEETTVYYMFQGDGSIVCNLTLTALSSNFSEKLWKKNITLPPVPFSYVGTAKWSSSRTTLLDEVMQDNSVFNEIAKLLENQYQEILDLVEKQIDVEEMKTVVVEAKKVDRKN